MKIAVRAFVLALLVTGFAADHMLATKTAPTATTTMMASSMSAAPAPFCRLGTSCGIK